MNKTLFKRILLSFSSSFNKLNFYLIPYIENSQWLLLHLKPFEECDGWIKQDSFSSLTTPCLSEVNSKRLILRLIYQQARRCNDAQWKSLPESYLLLLIMAVNFSHLFPSQRKEQGLTREYLSGVLIHKATGWNERGLFRYICLWEA